MKREFERESLFIFLILGKSQGPKKSLKDFIFNVIFILLFYCISSCVHYTCPSNVSLDILFRSKKLGGTCCMV